METIQVVIDAKLLKAANQAAKRSKLNRSALIRDALRAHLKRLKALDDDDRERRGYLAHPQKSEEWERWEKEAVWPDGQPAAM